MNVGILDLLTVRANHPRDYADCFLVRKQYASLTPQAISVWCRRMGHHVHYATYYGFGDPKARLPDGLDIVFISVHTPRAPLAYALSRAYRLEGTRTVIGGPHAKAYPQDCLRYFDLVVLECDQELIANIINNQFEPRSVVSSPKPYEDTPTIEERAPEIAASAFFMGRPYPGSVIPMLASMGCPYTCNFCIDWNAAYRPLSKDRLAEDLRFASRNFRGVMLGFDDPNFGIRFDETMTVFESIPAGRRNPYLIESSLSNIRPDRLKRLRDTNCFAVAPGIESWTHYSDKAGVGKAAGHEKLRRVVEQFSTLHEYVPYLQANFIFGLDTDAGDEPFELTKEFIRQSPFVFTYMNIPFAFGGTPMYDDFLRDGRILRSMPFTFYILPYLTLILKNYDPITYLEKMVDIYSLATSDEMLKARFAHSTRPSVKYTHALRTFFTRPLLRGLQRLLDRMRTDSQLISFHTGKTDTLPDYYASEYKRLLGKYADLMPVEESRPILREATAQPRILGPVLDSRLPITAVPGQQAAL